MRPLPRSTVISALGAALGAALVAVAAPAQPLAPGAGRSASSDTSTVPATVVDSASPRASVLGFLNAARAGDFARAATWLDVSAPGAAARQVELARRLKSVLDVKLWIDVERVSPDADGDAGDGLPADRELLGTIRGADEVEHPIRLARVTRAGSVRWVFSATTVAAVDELYDALPDNWIREYLPARLLAVGPFDILWWQWIALILLLPAAAMFGWTLATPTQVLVRRVVSRTRTTFDDDLVRSVRGPLVLLWGVAASWVLLRWIALSAPAESVVHGLQRGLAVVAAFWVLLRAIAVLQVSLPTSEWATHHPALRSLIPLGGRILRLVLIVLGALSVVASFGYPVATILAGLGIGGIAIALGAQKSLEHFFGSVSIGVDQPFRVGDFVEVDGVIGDVESIGLRSSQIRTLNRTLVTIPNGRLAEARAENYAARDRIRLHAMIGLEYGTTSATLRKVRDEIEALLRAHPRMHPDTVIVRFTAFGAYSLDIEIMCWIQTTVFNEFREVREELLLGIMEIVERNGAGFAFPRQTVHVRSEERGAR